MISKFRTTLSYTVIFVGLSAFLISGDASAQDKSNTTVSAAMATAVVDDSPITKDGRDFIKLSEEDVDALSDDEFDSYQKWKIKVKIAKGERLDAKAEQLDKDIAALQRELGIKASQSIQPLLADYKDGKTPSVSQELREVIIQIANGELPPANMRSQAQELVKYFE